MVNQIGSNVTRTNNPSPHRRNKRRSKGYTPLKSPPDVIRNNISYSFHTHCDIAFFDNLKTLYKALKENFLDRILIIPEISLSDDENQIPVENLDIYFNRDQLQPQELHDFIQNQMKEDVRLLAEEFAKPLEKAN